MQHELIRQFAKENFGPSYYVVPQGHSTTFQPLSLIVKENKVLGKLRSRRMVVMETIDLYLVDNKAMQSEVAEIKKKNITKGQEQQIDELIAASSCTTVSVDLVDKSGLTAKHNVNYGQLELGIVQEECYTDMGLRFLLMKAKIDRAKMQPYEKQKLYLITGVVYSTKLHITGERDRTDELDASFAWPRFNWFKTKLSVLAKTEPPPALGRKHRSPLLFKYAKVKYDPEKGTLELKEMVGPALKRHGIGYFEDVVADSPASPSKCLSFVSRDCLVFEDLMESTVSDPDVKLVAITTILQECDSFEGMRNRMRHYLGLATKAMSRNGKEIAVDDLLTSQDHELLQSMGIEVSTTDLKKTTILRVPQDISKDKVQDFIKIFHIFLDMEEQEWMVIKEFVDKDKDHSGPKDQKGLKITPMKLIDTFTRENVKCSVDSAAI